MMLNYVFWNIFYISFKKIDIESTFIISVLGQTEVESAYTTSIFGKIDVECSSDIGFGQNRCYKGTFYINFKSTDVFL